MKLYYPLKKILGKIHRIVGELIIDFIYNTIEKSNKDLIKIDNFKNGNFIYRI